MQMIDVMKRLAELDAQNPRMVKEGQQVEECGIMPSPMGMGNHTPASINMTADSGSELTGMLRDIMQLAGLNKVEPEHLGVEPPPMSITAEPVSAVGPAIAEPMSSADSMRSVLDKLNPEPSDDDGEELGPFQGNDAGEEEPEDDEEETDEGNAYGQAVQNTAPGEEIKIDGKGTGDIKKAEETYNNTPANPNDKNPVDADEYAHHENTPGGGETSNGEKRQSNLPTATFESLMKEYKQFIGEDEEEEDVEEGKKPDFLDLDKDGDKKEPMKKASKEVDESQDILKLAGLK